MEISRFIPMIISLLLFSILVFWIVRELLKISIYLFKFSGHLFQIIDRSSASNINEIIITHYDLDLTIDYSKTKYFWNVFENTKNRIYGSITHNFKAISQYVHEIYLDIQKIHILNVFLLNFNQNISLSFAVYKWDWIINEENDVLYIKLPNPLNFNETATIQIFYETLEQGGAGIFWLSEKQTRSKSTFFYTDCQTYFCRSLAPLQDTPAIKSTYDVNIRTIGFSQNSIILASGIKQSMPFGQRSEFIQEIPTASYLLSIVVGELIEKRTSPRTVIYAEPDMIDISVQNLNHMSDFLNIVFFSGNQFYLL